MSEVDTGPVDSPSNGEELNNNLAESPKPNDDEISLTETTISDDENKTITTVRDQQSPQSETDLSSGKITPVSDKSVSRPISAESAKQSSRPQSSKGSLPRGTQRPKSGSSEVSFVARKKSSKSTDAPPGSHEVTFTVTVSKAIPTLKDKKSKNVSGCADEQSEVEDEGQSDLTKSIKKRKRIVDAPKAQFYFHVEYYLLPTDDEPVKTDITSFGVAAKIYPERQDAKVLKTWTEDSVTWVAWTHSHTVVVTTELLKKLYTHVMEVRIWDSRDKVSQRARFDRPKAFRLPAVKYGEDPDDISGVKTLVHKQAKNFVKQHPKKSYLDRPVPSKDPPALPVRPDYVKPVKNPSSKVRRKETERSSMGPNADTDALVSVRTPISANNKDMASYAKLGDLAGLKAPTENRTASTPNAGTPMARRPKEVLSAVPPSPDSKGTGTPAINTGPNQQLPGITSGARRNRKSEMQAQAQADYIKKHGICSVPIRLALLFAGMKNITARLASPVSSVEDCFVSLQLDTDLMTEPQLMELNPMVIKVHSVTNMPETPLRYEQLRESCEPVYLQYKFFKRPVHRSSGKTAAKSIYWDDYSVVMAGLYETSELREFLTGPAIEIEVHDRDRLIQEEKKLKPSLFGDDLEDEKISNVGAVSAKRTHHNPLHSKPKPWDPYGVAKFSLSDLLLGQRVLHLSVPVHNCPLPDLLGMNSAGDGKVMGVSGAVDGPEDSYMPVGHYLDSGTTMKIKVELAHPLTTPYSVAAKPDYETTYECPYGRIAFIFDYHNTVILHKLQNMLCQINAEALDLTSLPSHVIEAALSTYKLSLEQQKSRTLNIATGFQVMDGVYHVFVIEGLRDGAIKDLWEAFPKSQYKDLLVLYNSDLSFHARLYGPLDVDVTRIKLHESLSLIASQPLLYVRDMVPKPCFEALVKLHDMTKTTKLRDAIRYGLFPSADMVVSMSREFGVPLTAADLEELEPKPVEVERSESQVNIEMNGDSQEPEELRPRTSRPWTPIDNYNPDFENQLRENSLRPMTKDFMQSHKDLVSARSDINRIIKSQQKPERVRVTIPGAHNYSTQTMNSTALAMDKVRDMLSGQSRRNFTFAEDFHHSGAFVPVNVEQLKKDALIASRDGWRTSKGWTYPGVKNLRQCNEHKMAPDPARAEALQKTWCENDLHANKLEPTLTRDTYPWRFRKEDLELYEKPAPEFGMQRPITIHLAGQKLKDELTDYKNKEYDVWKSKVVTADPQFHTHRIAIETELRDKGPKSKNQLTTLEGLLKDPQQKYSLKHSRGRLQDIPPLSVVLNPSVDTKAREAGIIPQPALESRETTRGYIPGEFLHRSCLLEKNRVPMYVYDHKNEGYFNLYHKERSSVSKRPVIPLNSDERNNHYFRIPNDNNLFHLMRPATTNDTQEVRYKSYPVTLTDNSTLTSYQGTVSREKTKVIET